MTAQVSRGQVARGRLDRVLAAGCSPPRCWASRSSVASPDRSPRRALRRRPRRCAELLGGGSSGAACSSAGCPDPRRWSERAVRLRGRPLRRHGAGRGAEPRGHRRHGERGGAAYVFRRGSGGSWTQQAELVASDGAADYDYFGYSVAVFGDTALVGAPRPRCHRRGRPAPPTCSRARAPPGRPARS